jgi:spherulation-specific family 4 protein
MADFITRTELASYFRAIADQILRKGTGILLPLYIRPGVEWDRVASVKRAHPSVSIIAIANPRNGPGDAKSATYAEAIPKLSSSGVAVGGYIHTQYGLRPMADVERDTRRWKEWYPDTASLFVDEFSSKPEHLTYYKAIQKLGMDLGFRCVVGNPGTRPHRDMYGAADVLVISERPDPPTVESLEQMAADGGEGKMGVLVHSAAAGLLGSWLPTARKHLAYVHITQDLKPSPWDTISAEFEGEAEMLD